MGFNATFNNISAILWWSVLLGEKTGVPGENHDLSHNVRIKKLHTHINISETWSECVSNCCEQRQVLNFPAISW